MNPIHFVSTPFFEEEKETYLVISSEKKIKVNTLLALGAVFFISSMFAKANSANKIMVLPLMASTLMMFSGIWVLSASAKIVFDKAENKIFCIYKHLGYWQKIYSYNLPSIDEVIFSDKELKLLRDDGNEILLAKVKPENEEAAKFSAEKIRKFLNIK